MACGTHIFRRAMRSCSCLGANLATFDYTSPQQTTHHVIPSSRSCSGRLRLRGRGHRQKRLVPIAESSCLARFAERLDGSELVSDATNAIPGPGNRLMWKISSADGPTVWSKARKQPPRCNKPPAKCRMRTPCSAQCSTMLASPMMSLRNGWLK